MTTDLIARLQAKKRNATEEEDDALAALEAKERENAELRNVCAEAYQLAGVFDAPIAAMDNLSAAANGDPLPHKTFLPIFAPDIVAERDSLAEQVKVLRDFVTTVLPDLQKEANLSRAIGFTGSAAIKKHKAALKALTTGGK